MLKIVFENDKLIAINKPPGLLVHKTSLAKDAKTFALQQLRNQLGQRVYPCHRLDRKTSGVLLFAKNPTANKSIQKLFREQQVSKSYLAIVRGFIPKTGIIDSPLKNGLNSKGAITNYVRIEQFEIPIASNKFLTSRYSLVKLSPLTGRFHQLRKHCAHIFHPIIGDRPHGCNKQNRLWKNTIGITEMLLHANQLDLTFCNERIQINAAPSQPFTDALEYLTKNNLLENASS